MKRFILIVCSVLFSAFVAGAEEETGFSGIERIAGCEVLNARAELAPLDAELLESVSVKMRDLASALAASGDPVSASSVNMWLMFNQKRLTNRGLVMLSEALKGLDEEEFSVIQTSELKEPNVALVLSIFLGTFGVDRFYIGDLGLGLGKFLTLGGCGVWSFIDIFCIRHATKSNNVKDIYRSLAFL